MDPILYVLITNNHVIDNEDLKQEKEVGLIFDNYGDHKIYKKIKIDKNRKTYTVYKVGNEIIDLTIIELRLKEDGFDSRNFLKCDDNIMNDYAKGVYKSKSIYLFHYENDKDIVSTSIGKIKEIKDNTITHTCATGMGSSGGPIISYNMKVIGIHNGRRSDGCKFGSLLQNAIKEYKKKFGI